jgi:hypothetical protein
MTNFSMPWTEEQTNRGNWWEQGVHANSVAGTKKSVGLAHLERVVDLLVGGVGPERVVRDGALHLREESLDLASVLLGVQLVEGDGREEAAGEKRSNG